MLVVLGGRKLSKRNGFTKYTNRMGGGSGHPMVRMNKDGQLTLNTAAAKKYNLFKYKGVEVFFDEERQKIGMNFVNKQGNEIYSLSRDCSMLRFHCSGFAKFFGIKPFKKRLEHIEENFYCVDLRQ